MQFLKEFEILGSMLCSICADEGVSKGNTGRQNVYASTYEHVAEEI